MSDTPNPKPKFLARVSPEEARSRLLDDVQALPSERIGIDQAHERTTAGPIVALHDAPHYRASAMDGIAVAAASTNDASPDSPLELASGLAAECAEIDTGGVLPAWADAVVRIEDTKRTERGFEIRAAVPPGRDVRRAGEDIDAGTRLLPRGAKIGAWDLGALIASGVVRLDVIRKPRLAILATGSEVVEPTAEPHPGQVLEFNGRMIEASARSWGAEVTRLGIVADNLEDLRKAIVAAAEQYDALAIIAGSSVGRHDFTVDVLMDAGEVLAHGVNMMPGKPVSIARVAGTPVVGIPGYPVSAIVAAEQLLKPLIHRLGGSLDEATNQTLAKVVRKIPSKLGVEEFRRVCLCWHGDDFVVAPLPRGAGAVSTASRAHAWLRIGPQSEGVDAGASIQVDLIRSLVHARSTVVLASAADPQSAALEDQLRKSGKPINFAWMGNNADNSIEALAAGEAHGAVLAMDENVLERLKARVPDAVTTTLGPDSILALAPFAASLDPVKAVLEGA